MRVIDQARLQFREGTSDKVYEVDLVEVATNQYVVNFRFGRRGGALKDGTKTALPVALDKARSVFQKLVDEKLAGGYQRAGAAAAPAPVPSAPPIAASASTSEGARLIGQLRQGARSTVPLGPVIWRVTDLDLEEAEPVLLELLASTFVPRDFVPGEWKHLIVTALARCGSAASLPALTDIATSGAPHHLRDMAKLAIARIDPVRAGQLVAPQLPSLSGDVARLAEEILTVNPTRGREVAVALYLANDARARPGVLAIARVARLSNAEASIVRALFRLAEANRDGELYALLARRIDAYSSRTRPFSPKTRQYIRRRVARVLRRLGRAGSPDYVPMAWWILFGVDDEDAVPPKRGQFNHWYDAFAPFHAFNQILYTHSPRYEKAHHVLSVWKCKGRYRPGEPAPAQREEAFPELWDRAPNALWEFFTESGATPVIEFAVKALRANRAFTTALPDAEIAAVLVGGHPLAQRFAFELARTRPMTIILAQGELGSDLPEAHAHAVQWIDSHLDEAAADPDLVALLVTGPTPQVRDTALRLVRARPLTEPVARRAAARAIAMLLAYSDSPARAERASASIAPMLAVLEAPLRELGPDVLRDMIKHPLAGLGELAGEIMLRHAHRDSLPGDLIEALLSSPHATVRSLGGRMIALTPPEIAKDDLEALVLFATSANAELREATRPLLAAIATKYPDVGRQLADRLIDALLKTQPHGAPAHIVSLLRGELAGVLPQKPAATILRLIGALSPHARDAGGLLLPQLGPDDIGLDDIARLASNESRAMREGAWALARVSIARYRMAPVALAKLVDSQWEDTRGFAIAFIRDEVGGDKLGPDAIITICDSIRPEVQELGKTLLMQQFREADAGKYLVRLAEHPSVNLQLLVSGLLDRHASELAQLRSLLPYFATVLSQVNRGRVAKERVLAVLRREAARSPEHAALLAPLLDRQSATIAISHKHPIIATMVDVHHLYPSVPLPISVIPARRSESVTLHPGPPKGAH